MLLIRRGDISAIGVFINEPVTGTQLACPRHRWSPHADQVWCRSQLLNRSWCCCMELFFVRCKTLYLSLLSFTNFLSAYFSKSPWMAAVLLSASTHPPSLVSSVNVTVASSKSVMKTVKRTCPRTALCGTPLATSKVWPVHHYLLSLVSWKWYAKPKAKCSWETLDCDLATWMDKSDEHLREGSTNESGQCSCAILTDFLAFVIPFLQEASCELSTSWAVKMCGWPFAFNGNCRVLSKCLLSLESLSYALLSNNILTYRAARFSF